MIVEQIKKENLIKEIEVIKKNKMKIIEQKNRVT